MTSRHRHRHRAARRRVLGVLFVAVGVIWFGQGIGLIGGSFMSGEAVWAVIGAVAILFGIVLVRPRARSA